MRLIAKGHASSWKIASYYESVGIEMMVYKNINRRILILAREGFIEEVPYTKRTKHGRIDYRLTSGGMDYLLPYLPTHSEDIQAIVKHMSKEDATKDILVKSSINSAGVMIKFLNRYLKVVLDAEVAAVPGKHRNEIETLKKESMRLSDTLNGIIEEIHKIQKSQI